MLHYNTVNNLLKESLVKLMGVKEFESFRLVGGTSLSLQIGHRESVDIDMFSDLTYDSIDFNGIDSYLDKEFPYVDDIRELFPGMGKSYLIGKDKENAIKLDVYHKDDFIVDGFGFIDSHIQNPQPTVPVPDPKFRIDYIFYNRSNKIKVTPQSTELPYYEELNLYLSDHYPCIVTIERKD